MSPTFAPRLRVGLFSRKRDPRGFCRGSLDVRLYAEDMLGFCERALAYTAGLEQSDWTADRMRYDATLRNLELIGEAASRVPQTMRDAAAHLPWRQMVATRNRLIHAYLGIDDDIVWNIISSDLPTLRAGLIELLGGC